MNSSNDGKELQRVVDLVRNAGFVVFLMNCYFYCYGGWREWGLASVYSDRVMESLARTGLFDGYFVSKLWALGLLLISLLGARGRKSTKIGWRTPVWVMGVGLLLYFGSVVLFYLEASAASIAVAYLAMSAVGYCLVMAGGSLLSRIVRTRIGRDVFNELHETFPQETKRIDTEQSVNLPYTFQYRGKTHKGWINLNMARGLLVCASSGGGKSWYIIQHIIRQHIEKGHSMFIYDFKFGDLTLPAYNYYLRYKGNYSVEPQFFSIVFTDLCMSHRCNPLAPDTMTDIEDAQEGARSFLLGLNPHWVSRQGDFWVESSVAFFTALIWYLRKFDGGRYCTLAHVIELSQQPFHKLFSVLRMEPDIRSYFDPFLTAYLGRNRETVGNQMVSLKVAVARLSTPAIYYVTSGNDLSLDINNPKAPAILCMGSSPQRSGIYGAVISLYVSTMNRLVNKKGMVPCSQLYDEATTVYNHQLPELIATGRSNKIAVTLCVQSYSQLKARYGKDQADVLFELPANKIIGQQTGEAANQVSAWIGKIVQKKVGIQLNSQDASVSESTVLDPAVTVSRVAKLSSGEFVGVVADDPDHVVGQKAFHGKISQDNEVLADEHARFTPLPKVRSVTKEEVQEHFLQIGREVKELVENERQRMMDEPSLAELVIEDIDY